MRSFNFIGNFVFLSVLLLGTSSSAWAQDKTMSLAGEWRFQTDPKDQGVSEKWFNTALPETIKLPGSMAENGKGNEISLTTQWTASIYDSSWFFNPRLAKYRQPGNIKIPFWLTPAKHYVGAAWYQKEVTIPKDWKDRRIVLTLERAHTETRLWVDGVEQGMQNSMVAPHTYELTGTLPPGQHTLTVRVDNRIKDINVGPDSHSLTDHTQGNWNGIVGRIDLTAGAHLWFEDVQVYPDLARKTAKVKLRVQNETGKPAKGTVKLAAQSFNSKSSHKPRPINQSMTFSPGETSLELDLPLGEGMLTWDEFDPALYRLTVSFAGGKGVSAEKRVQFGMREFKIKGTQFEVNGRPVFLRGTLHNCEFPLTGYPAMNVPAWERIFRVARAHGLNHIRFHSWCPPEAAFAAADLVGLYLQPEGPSWPNHGTSVGDGKPVDRYLIEETVRMEQAYGNYASYCMLAVGNEPAGRYQVRYLTDFVNFWKARDPRRVYTGASVAMSWPLVPANEFMVKSGSRGLAWNEQPESLSDYRDKIKDFKVPYVTHEMGQWCVFPNFKEIKKYTGVYKARNFELFEEDLRDQGMGDQGEAFLQASGKLQALCYKAEIEKGLRTPGSGGFQLLGLQDFPGQGTALVGVIDAFWEEKGYITAQEFSRFCGPTVPLARLPKFTFTSDETLEADLELYHYGQAALPDARSTWKITDGAGQIVGQGSFDPKTISVGGNTPLGKIRFPLTKFKQATKLNLEVSLAGTDIANDWDVWVYPAKTPSPDLKEVHVTTSLDQKAQDVLAKGGKVYLQLAGKVVKGKEVANHFTPVFWNTSWFKMRPPHTLGFVTDPRHPLFADFPTESHSNLQWWEIVNRAQVMVLEDFPAGFRPIVQPIDTWFMNRRLGLILEARVGPGKLLVCSADLTSDPEKRVVARQLYHNVLRYMQSPQFDPQTAVELAVVQDLTKKPTRQQWDAYTKGSPDELKPKEAVLK